MGDIFPLNIGSLRRGDDIANRRVNFLQGVPATNGHIGELRYTRAIGGGVQIHSFTHGGRTEKVERTPLFRPSSLFW